VVVRLRRVIVAATAVSALVTLLPSALSFARFAFWTDRLWLGLLDGGVGFDPAARRHPDGFGMVSMRERAEGAGGEFHLASCPGEGTWIEVVLSSPT
jgi:signal transduction histidine kinase